ncbi:MAG TPA: HEAT repeat domain-containing protein [Vicinamibacterales bacterium]|nr:HEAT repeat domain-containing protein [Vicinamibacterales bacterium]HOQ59786.1 HEAT repeat domain-containing protein [Vicinamibacterales bacterium]HPK71365.1 HEAT repeat domain-containing protein [Vicinamibacterales bacterium]
MDFPRTRRGRPAVALVMALAALLWAPAARAADPQAPGAAQPSLLDQMRSEAKSAIAAAVAAGRPGEALETYDRLFASVKKHDLALLAPVASGLLGAIASDVSSLARIPALERLARSGDAAARGLLESAAGGRNTLMPAGIEADCALARLGDSPAVDRLIRRLPEEVPRDKGAIITALKDAGAKRAAYAIVPFLGDANPSNRLAAIRALAEIGSREHVPAMRAAFEAETHAGMRQSLAMALHAVGSNAGDAVLAQAEASRVPDVQLLALEAYHASGSPRWPALARELLRSPGEGARLRAAQLLGVSDADAMRELARAASSPNTPTREVGARLLESAGCRDAALLVTLLHDASPFVRTYAAGAALAAAK